MARDKGPPRSAKAAIVTVHGTGDSASSESGDKWWQAGSPFARRLEAVVAAHGVETEYVPFIWSGANSAVAREAASNGLAKLLAEQAKRHASVHVIGHSHGGNVANEAACSLRMFEALRASAAAHPITRYNPTRFLLPKSTVALDSLTTVGTPFFATKLSPAESFNPGAAVALAGFGVMGFVAAVAGLAASTIIGPMLSTAMGGAGSTGESLRLTAIALGLLVLLVLNCVGAWHLVRHGFAEFARRTRLNLTEALRKNAAAARTRIQAIWHTNDEAIAFLQKIETVPIEPLQKGMLYSRSRRIAIVNGIRFAIFTPIAIAALSGLAAAVYLGFTLATRQSLPADWSAYWILPLIAIAVAVGAAPLLFGVAYLSNRLVFGVLPESARSQLNRFIRGTFTGMAFGRDGAEAIGSVTPRSHVLETDDVVLEGELAARMQEKAAAASGKLIDKYRWALFTVGADTNASLTAMATDAMTWDSLIHTTYFDQPEIATMIGEHIASRHVSATAQSRVQASS